MYEAREAQEYTRYGAREAREDEDHKTCEGQKHLHHEARGAREPREAREQIEHEACEAKKHLEHHACDTRRHVGQEA